MIQVQANLGSDDQHSSRALVTREPRHPRHYLSAVSGSRRASALGRAAGVLSRWRGGTLSAGALALLTIPLITGHARAQTLPDLRRQLDRAITAVESADAPLLSAARYAEARQRYAEVDALLRKGAPFEAVRGAVDRAVSAAQQATAIAADIRGMLGEVLAARATVLGLDSSMPSRVPAADALLGDSARRAEAGDRPGATRIAEQALAEYAAAGRTWLREEKLAGVRQALERLRPTLPEEVFANAIAEYRTLEPRLQRAAEQRGRMWLCQGWDRLGPRPTVTKNGHYVSYALGLAAIPVDSWHRTRPGK
jgi:hypothetical protein